GRPVEAPHGRYYRWAPGAGVELWAGVDADRELTGFSPHLAGEGRMRVRVDALERDRQAPLTGVARGVAVDAEPPNAIVLDVPDFDLLSGACEPGDTATFQVAAFGHEVHSFETAAAFEASGADRPARSVEMVQGSEEQRADCLLSGAVLRAEL